MSGFLLPKALLQLCQLSVKLKFILQLATQTAISFFHEKLQKVIANNCSLCRHHEVGQKFNLQQPWLVVTVLPYHAILNTNKHYFFPNLLLRKNNDRDPIFSQSNLSYSVAILVLEILS